MSTRWRCRRCDAIFHRPEETCKCTTSPSPWEPAICVQDVTPRWLRESPAFQTLLADTREQLQLEHPHKMRFPSITTFIRAVWKFLGRPELVPNTIEYIRTYRCGCCIFEENQQCQKCSCYIPLKVKMATESCPEKKWGQYYNSLKHGL